KKRTGWVILLGIGFAIIFFFMLAISLIVPSPNNRSSSKASLSPSPATNLSLVSKATPGTPIATPSAWRYDTDVDQMSGKKSQSASVKSSNTVRFDFPYEGAQHGTLTLRKHPRWGNNVMLKIERGQFMAHVTGVQVLARFDDGGPVKFWAVGPEDHSTTILFINDYSRFVAQLRKAKTVRLSTPIYQHGSPVFEFDVAGLEGF